MEHIIIIEKCQIYKQFEKFLKLKFSKSFLVNCQVLFLRDESPVEDDTDFKTNPNIHQTIQYDQWSEGELKKEDVFYILDQQIPV